MVEGFGIATIRSVGHLSYLVLGTRFSRALSPSRQQSRPVTHSAACLAGRGCAELAIASASNENRRPDLLQNSQLDFQSRHVMTFLATHLVFSRRKGERE